MDVERTPHGQLGINTVPEPTGIKRFTTKIKSGLVLLQNVG